MFEAQLLRTAGSSDVSVFSPWFPRGGDSATFTVDLVGSKNADLILGVYTKNSEDSGEGAAVGTPVTVSTIGQATMTIDSSPSSGLKEMVRYRFTATKNGTGGQWVLFRMLSPVWFDDVKA